MKMKWLIHIVMFFAVSIMLGHSMMPHHHEHEVHQSHGIHHGHHHHDDFRLMHLLVHLFEHDAGQDHLDQFLHHGNTPDFKKLDNSACTINFSRLFWNNTLFNDQTVAGLKLPASPATTSPCLRGPPPTC